MKIHPSAIALLSILLYEDALALQADHMPGTGPGIGGVESLSDFQSRLGIDERYHNRHNKHNRILRKVGERKFSTIHNQHRPHHGQESFRSKPEIKFESPQDIHEPEFEVTRKSIPKANGGPAKDAVPHDNGQRKGNFFSNFLDPRSKTATNGFSDQAHQVLNVEPPTRQQAPQASGHTVAAQPPPRKRAAWRTQKNTGIINIDVPGGENVHPPADRFDPNNQGSLSLRVGGRPYDVSKGLLQKFRYTKLAQMAFNSPLGLNAFDGNIFRYVHLYMKNGGVLLPPDISKAAFARELAAYGFEMPREGSIVEEQPTEGPTVHTHQPSPQNQGTGDFSRNPATTVPSNPPNAPSVKMEEQHFVKQPPQPKVTAPSGQIPHTHTQPAQRAGAVPQNKMPKPQMQSQPQTHPQQQPQTHQPQSTQQAASHPSNVFKTMQKQLESFRQEIEHKENEIEEQEKKLEYLKNEVSYLKLSRACSQRFHQNTSLEASKTILEFTDEEIEDCGFASRSALNAKTLNQFLERYGLKLVHDARFELDWI